MVVELKDWKDETIRIIEKDGKANEMASTIRVKEFCSSGCVATFIQDSKDKAIREYEVKKKKKELDMLKVERDYQKYKEWAERNGS
jgi:predicted ATP-binding protein involved in virulence